MTAPTRAAKRPTEPKLTTFVRAPPVPAPAEPVGEGVVERGLAEVEEPTGEPTVLEAEQSVAADGRWI